MKIHKTALSALLLIGLIMPIAAKAPTWPALGIETKIVFPNYGAIRNFDAQDDDGLWLEDSRRRWYYAELFGPCHGLNFAHAIGFDTRGAPTFDKYSSIIVDGQTCKLASLVTAEKPLSRKERKRLAKEAKAAQQADLPATN